MIKISSQDDIRFLVVVVVFFFFWFGLVWFDLVDWFVCFALTLKRPRYFYSRWCPRGGPRDPSVENHFPTGICNEICTIYVWAIKIHNSVKKNWKCCTVSKWRPNNRFIFRGISILAKIWKNHFPKRICQWNLAQSRRTWIHLHYWNNIWKKLFCFKMAGKTIFWYCAIMLIYAN